MLFLRRLLHGFGDDAQTGSQCFHNIFIVGHQVHALAIRPSHGNPPSVRLRLFPHAVFLEPLLVRVAAKHHAFHIHLTVPVQRQANTVRALCGKTLRGHDRHNVPGDNVFFGRIRICPRRAQFFHQRGFLVGEFGRLCLCLLLLVGGLDARHVQPFFKRLRIHTCGHVPGFFLPVPLRAQPLGFVFVRPRHIQPDALGFHVGLACGHVALLLCLVLLGLLCLFWLLLRRLGLRLRLFLLYRLRDLFLRLCLILRQFLLLFQRQDVVKDFFRVGSCPVEFGRVVFQNLDPVPHVGGVLGGVVADAQFVTQNH